jgi:hypothetical protein
MRANTMELEKVNVGERVIRAATQALGEYTNAGATFSKVELTTKKIRLDWEVSAEGLEDNIEGAGLEDHLVRLMTNAFANDIEDLAINGTGNSGDGAFLGIMEGFVNKVKTEGDAHESLVTVSNNAWTTEVMQNIILAMPRKYRALKNNLKFYAGSDAFQGIVKNNGTLADAISEAFAPKTAGTAANRQAYLDGNGQTFGGARTTRVLGIDVQEVYIYAILEGIFYTKLITSNGIEDAEIDCTAGDGIALSIVYGCPLYASKEVLDLSGVYINDDGSTMDNSDIDDIDDYEEVEETPKRVVSIEDLEHMIEDAIRNEEYEIAAEIRDRIEKLKKEGK